MIRKYFSIGFMLAMMVTVGSTGVIASDSKKIKALEKMNGEESKYEKGESALLVYYENGLKVRSHDNKYKFQVGGRIMHDWGFFDEDKGFVDNFGIQGNGTLFRRVRLYLAGTLYNIVNFKFDIDVSRGFNKLTLKDMYISASHIPFVGNFQVGHFKRPASLDSVSSSNFLTFIERSLTNTFFKTRNVGFAFFNQHFDKRLTWFTFFNKATEERPQDFRIDGDWNVTSRVTGLPYISEDGKKWVHLGASWSYENPNDNTITYNAARDTEITSTFLTTGPIMASRANIVGVEGSVSLNQFSIQSEYVFSDVKRLMSPNGLLDSFYVQASWYLTGEHRHYSRKTGSIARFKPNQNFSWNRNWSEGKGIGALQLAIRYAHLDLNDVNAGIAGGEQSSITAGLNWELTSQSRLMYNFVHAYIKKGIDVDSGTLDSHIVRFQVDF